MVGEIVVGESVVLAYSGGLDTSVLVGWLQDEGYDVHCLYVDLGQPCEDRAAIMKKARALSAAGKWADWRRPAFAAAPVDHSTSPRNLSTCGPGFDHAVYATLCHRMRVNGL